MWLNGTLWSIKSSFMIFYVHLFNKSSDLKNHDLSLNDDFMVTVGSWFSQVEEITQFMQGILWSIVGANQLMMWI